MYIDAANGSDTITYEQTMLAEANFICYELEHSYKSVYSKWKSGNSSNLESTDAAYDAGYKVCYNYERPSGYKTKSVNRGNLAIEYYQAMVG